MYDNDHLQRIIDTATALQDANNTNTDAKANLADAQSVADAAEAEVTRLNAELDALTKSTPPAAYRRR